MKMNWADLFFKQARNRGAECAVKDYVNGWPETALLEGKVCYTKSKSYDRSKREYFIGVDPKKLADKGDYALICGGMDGQLNDIFVIPWTQFFGTVNQGEPVNTYKDREYLQYKVHIRNDGGRWTMSVQGGSRSRLDVSQFRFDPNEALEPLMSH